MRYAAARALVVTEYPIFPPAPLARLAAAVARRPALSPLLLGQRRMLSSLALLVAGAALSTALATAGKPAAVPAQSFDALFAAADLVPLKGQRALVTGASAGIGKAVACALAAAGCDLVLVARRSALLDELAREIKKRSLPGAVCCIAGDVASDDLYKQIRAQGPLDFDIVIANAGLARGTARIGQASLKDWHDMMEVNTLGAFRTINECIPDMIKRGSGHIVTIGSIAGLEPYEGGSVYCASKAALHSFSKALRYETYDKGIRVTVVAPGFVGEGTEFSQVRLRDGELAAAVYNGLDELRASDVAVQVLWALRQPPHVNVDLVHVMPSAQGGSGRVYRRGVS